MSAFASVCLAEAVRISGEYKRLAGALDVNWRTVYKWGTGEAAIPAEREEPLAAGLSAMGPGPSSSECLRAMARLIDDLAKAEADKRWTAAEAAGIRADVQRAIYHLEVLARTVDKAVEP